MLRTDYSDLQTDYISESAPVQASIKIHSHGHDVNQIALIAQSEAPAISEEAAKSLLESVEHANRAMGKTPFEAAWVSHSDAYLDRSPIRPFVIGPAITAEGSVMFIGGAPKAGKTDFLMHMFTHFAAGESFQFFTVQKKLRIAYLQCEVTKDTLRFRIHHMGLPEHLIEKGKGNFFYTEKFDVVFTPENLEKAADAISKLFDKFPPDVIAIDPLRNVLDTGNAGGGENNNDAMMAFLRNCKVHLRDKVNPLAVLVFVHHTKKQDFKDKGNSIFDSLSGASAIRGAYDSCIIITLEDPSDPMNTRRKIWIESRAAIPGIPEMHPPACSTWDKANGGLGTWEVVADQIEQRVGQALVQKKNREKRNDAILQFLAGEAKMHGRLYTKEALIKTLEDKQGFASEGTVRKRVDVLIQKWHIKFCNTPSRYGKDYPMSTRKTDMYLVIPEMEIPDGRFVMPTHCRNRNDNSIQELNDDRFWQYND